MRLILVTADEKGRRELEGGRKGTKEVKTAHITYMTPSHVLLITNLIEYCRSFYDQTM